jgi:polar amino acid transport system substrate-binding protein
MDYLILMDVNLHLLLRMRILPFNYIDAADGEAKGWDYDVFNHMGELMNFVPVYVPAAWDGMIQAVADGQFMVAGDGITITAERDEIIDFSVDILI